MALSSSRRTGRRPGETQTREAIATAAREEFAAVGYERATMRSIAGAAGVDPSLIVHFFGSKEALFREVAALPPEVTARMAALADGAPGDVGRRFAEMLVGLLESPVTRPIVLARVRAAATHPEAAALVRDLVSRDLVVLTSAVTDDRPEVRATLAGAQVVGLAFARCIVAVEPLASLPPAELVDVLAPTFQRILVGPLTA